MLPALTSFVQGDALNLSVAPCTLIDGRLISAAAGWSLKLSLRGASTLDLTANTTQVDAAGNWLLAATGAQTAALTAGAYGWIYTATDAAGVRATLSSGTIDVQPDLTLAAAGYDPRTTAQKALGDAEAALASFKASGGRVRSYSIGGRSMTFETAAELLSLVNYWRVRVANEKHAAAAAQGLGDPSKLLVRFR